MSGQFFNMENFLEGRRQQPDYAYAKLMEKANAAKKDFANHTKGAFFKKFAGWLGSEISLPLSKRAPDDVYRMWGEKIQGALLAKAVETFLHALKGSMKLIRKGRWFLLVQKCVPEEKRKRSLVLRMQKMEACVEDNMQRLAKATIEIRPHVSKRIQNKLDEFRLWLVQESKKPLEKRANGKIFKQKERELYIAIAQNVNYLDWRCKFWCWYYRIMSSRGI